MKRTAINSYLLHVFLSALLFLSTFVVCSGQSASENINGKSLSFIPDYTFKGSVISGWNPIGSANWKAQNGELIGTSNSNGNEGWLLFNQSFEDIGINTLLKTSRGTEAGILLRGEKSANGMKALLISVTDDSTGAYKVVLDRNGKILSKEKLRTAGGMIRIAPPPNPNATAARGGGSGGGSRRSGPNLPVVRPETAFKPGEWNQLEFILDMNILRGFINDGNGPGGAEDSLQYGVVGLYVKGPGEVRFKDFKYKDLGLRYTPKEQTSSRFQVQQISDMYYSWSSASADFNKDGVLDIVAGPHIYYGPDYTKFREIFPGFAYNPSKEFTEVNCQYTYDFNNDGWSDVFVGPPFGRLYINPKGEARRWDVYSVIPGNINSEVTVFTDVDGDGKPDLVYGTNSGGNGVIKYATFDTKDPTKAWTTHTISGSGYFTAHGIGTGDINGDGRVDILNPNGWWEQPSTKTDSPWIYHPEAFARYGHRSSGMGGSVMAVYDVNGDKLNDVVTSLNAHGFGLAWFEQKKDNSGKSYFVRHMIMDDYSAKNPGNVSFSELHGSTFADVDGDGITDFIVGKRYFSHVDTYLDPDPYGPPVLYWFRTVRNPKAPGGAEFIPELIHNRSGAGSDLLAIDLNKDGAIDIISSTNRGTFIFWNKKPVKK